METADIITEEEYLSIREDVDSYLQDRANIDPLHKLSSGIHRSIVIEQADETYKKAELIEPAISLDVSGLVEPEYSELRGFEHRLKTIRSLRRKIIADSKDYQGSYLEAANNLSDVVRYTIVIPDELYVEKVDEYLNKLESIGYTIIDFKNNWGKDTCQGYNVRLGNKDGNGRFELQFHTPFGYQIKEGSTRDLYEVIRDENADLEAVILKIKAEKLRRALQKRVPVPKGAIEYKYNRKEVNYGKQKQH